MELTNATPLTARVFTTSMEAMPRRIGQLVAKATYTFTADGQVAPDLQNPLPIFGNDQETPEGIIPRDDLPRRDEAFEVLCVGAAYPPNGAPVERLVVALSVGSVRREIVVHGERAWTRDLVLDQVPSRAEPFTRMPLSHTRAFGGSTEVFIDTDSAVTIEEPQNPAGRGFDPGPQAEGLCRSLRAPPGFPVYDRTRRLPNLEDPRSPITRWGDTPRPAYWSAVPMHSGLHLQRQLVPGMVDDPTLKELMGSAALYHRAHPDWVIARPEARAPVVLEGLVPEYRAAFRLPALRVHCDYVLGARRGTRELLPQTLVLFPEQHRFTMLYRLPFNFEFAPHAERAMRLRTEPGWYGQRAEAIAS